MGAVFSSSVAASPPSPPPTTARRRRCRAGCWSRCARLVREQLRDRHRSAWRGEEIRVLASLESGAAVRVAGVERGPYRCPHARATGKLLLAFADPLVLAAWVLGEGELEELIRTLISRPP